MPGVDVLILSARRTGYAGRMKRAALVSLVLVAVAGCGSDDRPVNIPVVPTGAFEAACQQLCTRDPADTSCTAKHAEFCLARCRASTNGMTAACGQCLVTGGAAIHGDTDGFGDPYCAVGGSRELSGCRDECDDSGAGPAAPSLADLCELTCAFYMSDVEPLACSDDGAASCRSECATAIAGNGRVCAQCLIEQTGTSRTCINGVCDCEPFFDSDPTFGCATLCDTQPPA